MGGYGFPIGEGKKFKIFMMIDTSSDYPKVYFKLEDNEGFTQVFEDWVTAEYGKPLYEAIQDLESEYELFKIKDEITHDKAIFEKDFKSMERELNKARERIVQLNEKIDNIKKLL